LQSSVGDFAVTHNAAFPAAMRQPHGAALVYRAVILADRLARAYVPAAEFDAELDARSIPGTPMMLAA
jgi:hypothetical protein